ncbi:MAG: Gldg family protein [Treponema sp.]|nr:Gldg family protein [Treponema sp.]
MKKIIQWLKNPASDFALFVIVLILANLVCNRAFLRLDLTAPQSYSLSSVSKQTVRTLTEPVTVQVFFSDGLPAPYNTVDQYINDILVEYKGAAKGKFSYTFFDMNKQENRQLASGYGLKEVPLRMVSNTEMGVKQAWMGIAILYTDNIQIIDPLTTADGFEYKLTTTIAKMISTSDTLASLPQNDKLSLTLYLSNELKSVKGFDQLETTVKKLCDDVNKKNKDRLVYSEIAPSESDIANLTTQYGIKPIIWQTSDKTTHNSVLNMVLSYNDKFLLMPLGLQKSLFGFSYSIVGLDSLEDSINKGIQSLVSHATEIGYITGHGEADINDSQRGSGTFNTLVSDMYSFKELNLASDDIPVSMSMIVINGPKTAFSEKELYAIDQFLMRGGNLMFFIDPFDENQNPYTGQSTFTPIDTGLNQILTAYGITPGTDYIMDEVSYRAEQQGMGMVPWYWAPMLQKKSINQKSVISKNLGYLIFLQNGSLDVSNAKSNPDLKVTELAQTSPRAWTQSEHIMLNPMMVTPPSDKSKESVQNLAVLVEGKFTSAYEAMPSFDDEDEAQTLSAHDHLAKSIQSGKIFISGSSFITSPALIDENGQQPIAIFIRNAIDYLNGQSELCTMRTKGLSLNGLELSNVGAIQFAKYFNEFGLGIIVALIGLFVWKSRNERRRQIHDRYNPNDERDLRTAHKAGTTNAENKEGTK